MATTLYYGKVDLENLVTARKLIQLTDDDQDGIADAAVLTQVITLSCAQAESWVEPEFVGLFPFPSTTPIPDMLKQLALLYGGSMLFERHPEYVKKYGEEKRAEGWRTWADRLGEQLQSHVRSFADLAAQAENVGGVTVNNTPSLLISSVDGSYVGGDF